MLEEAPIDASERRTIVCSCTRLPWRRRKGCRFWTEIPDKPTLRRCKVSSFKIRMLYVLIFVFSRGRGVKAASICLRNTYLDFNSWKLASCFCWHSGAGPSTARNYLIWRENSLLWTWEDHFLNFIALVLTFWGGLPGSNWKTDWNWSGFLAVPSFLQLNLSGQVLPSCDWPKHMPEGRNQAFLCLSFASHEGRRWVRVNGHILALRCRGQADTALILYCQAVLLTFFF